MSVAHAKACGKHVSQHAFDLLLSLTHPGQPHSSVCLFSKLVTVVTPQPGSYSFLSPMTVTDLLVRVRSDECGTFGSKPTSTGREVSEEKEDEEDEEEEEKINRFQKPLCKGTGPRRGASWQQSTPWTHSTRHSPLARCHSVPAHPAQHTLPHHRETKCSHGEGHLRPSNKSLSWRRP